MLQALSIILVVPYRLFYVISCVAKVCLSCEGVEQYREEIECNCYIFNFDRVTHKLTPQSTWLFYRKRSPICLKDLVFCRKNLVCRKDPNCRKGHKDNIKTNLVKYLKY